MNCDEFRKTGDRAHLASCVECRTWEALRAYPEIGPSRDFFRGIRSKLAPRILRFAAPIAAAAAVLLVAVVLTLHPTPPALPAVAQPTDEERELVENLEILQDYELLRSLEFIGENGEERK
ncbi:MAG TPA: hypothetical protein VF950_06320 [Planctomycetota bacterium]